MPSPLYPILDAAWLPREDAARRRTLAAVSQALAEAGVTLLQYRNKQDEDARCLDDVRLLRAAAPTTLRIVLNDRAHLVAAAGCDGVHVGQGDLPVATARSIVGPARLVGLSTHDDRQLIAGAKTSADYLAIGPIYPTDTKPDADPVVGLEGLRRARSLTTKPLVAIGGITLARAPELRAAGADSLAVISALFGPLRQGENAPSPAALKKLAEDFLSVFR